MSGLNQQFTKLSSCKRLREFESHILRKITSVLTTIFCAVQKQQTLQRIAVYIQSLQS